MFLCSSWGLPLVSTVEGILVSVKKRNRKLTQELGPLLWAPLSELFGRQILFIGTYCALTAFNCGAAGSKNIWTLIILRFFAGSFGSSPLTNAGGVIADMFPAKQRGVAMSMFAAAPFLGKFPFFLFCGYPNWIVYLVLKTNPS